MVNWLKQFFSKKTKVYLQRGFPHSMAFSFPVEYDQSGRPYVVFCNEPIRLNADGTTDETLMFGTHWRIRSGPPVAFA